MTRLRHLPAAILAAAVAAGIVVAIPAALIVSVGWPLPPSWPTADQLRQFTQTGITDATVIKTLAVIVWIAWAQLTVAIAVELAAAARRRAAHPLPLLPGLQPLAARLVATLALAAAATLPARPPAVALHAVVAAAPTDAPPAVPADTPPSLPDDSPRSSETVTVTTGDRDSWWGLAETHLGDGLRWRELRDANVGRTVADGVVIAPDTDLLEPGWHLQLPAGATPAAAAADDDPADPAGEWDVESGDHFWHIAEQTLLEAWGRPPTDREIAPYWRQLIDANRDRLRPPGDPDLIHPGQHLTIPAPPSDPHLPPAPATPPPTSPAPPAATSPPSPADSPPVDAPPTAPADPTGDGHEAAQARPDTSPDRPPTETAPAQPATPPSGWAAAVDRPDQPAADGRPTPDGATTAWGTPVGLTAGAAAASLMAAGAIATLRWRRRAALRQRGPGLRLPTPLPDAQGHTARLDATAIPDRSLDDLASLLTTIPDDVHPALVTTSDDGTVSLLFDDTTAIPNPFPAPWRLTDDGTDGPVGWSAQIGDRGRERSIGLPLLATLGRTDGPTIHANIAALPALTVHGDPTAVRRRLQAISLEVATSRVAVPVDVAVAGDTRLGTLDHLRHVDDLTAEVAAALDELAHDVIPEDRTPRLLVCHHDSDPPERLPAELAGTVGLVTATPVAGPGWQLELTGPSTATLGLPDDGRVNLTLPDLDPELVDDELTQLAEPATPPPDTAPPTDTAPPAPRKATPVRPPAQVNGSPHPMRPVEPAWCELRLLGPTELWLDGDRTDALTPRSLEVLAYLATHRDGVTKDRLDDAVWAGQTPRPGSQRVTAALTKLRAALGDGPDDQPLVPRRAPTHPIRLSDHVGTDLDRALAHLTNARTEPPDQQIHQLDAALALVRGEPFHDLPVSWATDICQRAIIELQDAALAAARTHRAAGRYDQADQALTAGLALFDPADVLYLERAEVAVARGRPDQVRLIWEQLRRHHADDADEIAGIVSTPTPEIELAFRELMAATSEG